MLVWSVVALMPTTQGPAPTRIEVHPEQVIAHVSRHMTGACIEDVNHEQYGGIYTQMVFGESFQEPPLSPPVRGFTAYEGRWVVGEDGALSAAAGPGPKLVQTQGRWADGAAGVEVRFDAPAGGNAGLVLRVREAGRGADAFIGYEISLDPARGVLVIGKHEHGWEPLSETPVPVPLGRWIPLSARLAEGRIEVQVDGGPAAAYVDPRPLAAGAVGLRTWQREARFRGLWTDAGEGRHDVPFASEQLEEVPGAVSGMWRAVRKGRAEGRMDLTTAPPFVGRQSQALSLTGGQGAVGIENQGLNRWGMCFRAGRRYEGCLWARAANETPLTVALESADGARTYAETRVTVTPADWQRVDFALAPNADDPAGRLALYLAEPGAVTLGYVALHPGEWGLYKGLASRRDVAEGLVEAGLTVLRNGGCMVNTNEYRWQSMVGPRDRRPPYTGFWYPWSSNGWGIVDFMQVCEAAGFLCVPAVNMGETPESLAALVAYANSPRDTGWGARRAADGHPKPYHLRYLQLGNEEAVNDDYWQRFEPLAEAIWAADPDLTLIVGDFAYNEVIEDPFHFGGSPRITSLAVQQKILRLAAAHDREVWFDVHVWSERPDAVSGVRAIPSFVQALRGLCPEARFKVCVLELNACRHDLNRALANARAINELERMGDDVRIVCSANCLQPDGQNDNGWDQGLLFLNPSAVWPQPPYFVMQMLSHHWLPLCIGAEVTGPADTLSVTAKRSEDGDTLQLQVVNFGPEDAPVAIDLAGFRPTRARASVEELTGAPDATNSADEPRRVAPRRAEIRVTPGVGSFEYRFPAHSFTILRLH